MTQARPADYWFSSSAIFIQLNAAGNNDYIHANCATGAMVLCYMKDIPGLGYDNGHNYRRWTLVASPTVFHDHNKRYVYIAIPRSDAVDSVAQFVFPLEELDIYGCNENGQQIGSTDYYYIWTQGIIAASEVSGVLRPREWEQVIDSGTLASDEAIAGGGSDSWWEYIASSDMVRFIKTISEAVFLRLSATWATITNLVLGGHTLDGVADDDTLSDNNTRVVTPSFGNKRYLSRTHDDTAAGNITLLQNLEVRGETILKRTATVGDYVKDIQVGIGSRSGVRIYDDGTIIARNLELSQGLSVPTIKYNSIEVLSGTRWDSAGKGRVKEIIDLDDSLHTCQFVLDLNDGEPGEFVVNDLLRGFWHNIDDNQNASVSSDNRHGQITRAGFQSIYCRVTNVANIVERTVDEVTEYIVPDVHYQPQDGDILLVNGLVTVAMRQFETNPATWSPAPSKWSVLSQSGYAGADHPERQKFTVYTTSYTARFEGVSTWDWQDANFVGAQGDLTGFAMLSIEDGQVHRREFTGEGFVTKNAYIYGTLDQFTRFSDRIQIVLSRPDGTIASGETLRADFALRDIEGTYIASGYVMHITRQSGDAAADAAWNAAIAAQYPDGIPSALNFVFNDIPEQGALYLVTATRQVNDGITTVNYTTSASFVLSRAYATEVFHGEWSELTTYARTTRTYPTVTYGGCKWYLVANSSTDDEPSPVSNVWHMVYGVEDLEIRFYNASGQRVTAASAYPGSVNIYLMPHLFCGNFDISDSLLSTDWSWSRYTGHYGEPIDTRTPADRQSDIAWPASHWPDIPQTRQLTITNDDLPPTWGSGPVVNFIITAAYGDLLIANVVNI